ncbi:hypothetical protein [Spiroplasma taiwanense]|uniref:Uncharacterized protein n=1 Tax=Spiroplasma taiwanense CT-1 TaxID=1276220 RepID=S5LTV5_9MOLU|nr:hypothetical protein [Spiroplasma taiwanense]AGR41149.1 hypothetical protein STAIW_v1c05200 [Spiroplasma taiwanense CT-1]
MAKSSKRDVSSTEIRDSLNNLKNTSDLAFERIEEVITDLLEQNNALREELEEYRAKVADILGSL